MPQHHCSSCKCQKDESAFKVTITPAGHVIGKTCHSCSEKRMKKANKENSNPWQATGNPDSQEAEPCTDEDTDFFGLTHLSLNQYLDALRTTDHLVTFAACVSMPWIGLNSKDLGDKLAKETWNELNYRFKYVFNILLSSLLFMPHKLSQQI